MVQRWQSALDEVQKVLSQDQALYAQLMDGSKDFEERAKALEAALPDDVPEEVMNLLKLLLQEGDLELLDDVASALAEVGSGARAPVKAEITSAAELTQKNKTALEKSLTEQFGDGLIFSFDVNPALMGGLRVRVGDRLIDTSVASKLASLRESLSNAVR